MTPRCGGIGIARGMKNSQWGWRIAALVSGNYMARDNIAILGDSGVPPGTACDAATLIGCRARFNGKGSIYGMSVGLTRGVRLGVLQVTGEGGLLFYHSGFRVVMTHIDASEASEFGYEDSKWTGWPNPFLGATLRYGFAYLGARYYHSLGHRNISLTTHSFTQLTGGVAYEWK